jgi:hypothetical protein
MFDVVEKIQSSGGLRDVEYECAASVARKIQQLDAFSEHRRSLRSFSSTHDAGSPPDVATKNVVLRQLRAQRRHGLRGKGVSTFGSNITVRSRQANFDKGMDLIGTLSADVATILMPDLLSGKPLTMNHLQEVGKTLFLTGLSMAFPALGFMANMLWSVLDPQPGLADILEEVLTEFYKTIMEDVQDLVRAELDNYAYRDIVDEMSAAAEELQWVPKMNMSSQTSLSYLLMVQHQLALLRKRVFGIHFLGKEKITAQKAIAVGTLFVETHRLVLLQIASTEPDFQELVAGRLDSMMTSVTDDLLKGMEATARGRRDLLEERVSSPSVSHRTSPTRVCCCSRCSCFETDYRTTVSRVYDGEVGEVLSPSKSDVRRRCERPSYPNLDTYRSSSSVIRNAYITNRAEYEVYAIYEPILYRLAQGHKYLVDEGSAGDGDGCIEHVNTPHWAKCARGLECRERVCVDTWFHRHENSRSFAGQMTFELKSRNGCESVNVKIDGVTTAINPVPVTWKEYSYQKPSSGVFTIVTNERCQGTSGDLYVRTAGLTSVPSSVDIAIPLYWQGWKCEHPDPSQHNRRCKLVKNGGLYWQGEYIFKIRADTDS